MRGGRLGLQPGSVPVRADSPVISSGACGTTSARSFASSVKDGDSTPWTQIRRNLGRGTSAHSCSIAWRSSAAQRTAAGRLKPWTSAHSAWVNAASRGMAPCNLNIFCPARGPKAMRQVHAAAGRKLHQAGDEVEPTSGASAAAGPAWSSPAQPFQPTSSRAMPPDSPATTQLPGHVCAEPGCGRRVETEGGLFRNFSLFGHQARLDGSSFGLQGI